MVCLLFTDELWSLRILLDMIWMYDNTFCLYKGYLMKTKKLEWQDCPHSCEMSSMSWLGSPERLHSLLSGGCSTSFSVSWCHSQVKIMMTITYHHNQTVTWHSQENEWMNYLLTYFIIIYSTHQVKCSNNAKRVQCGINQIKMSR